MAKRSRAHPDDLRGYTRLTLDAVGGLTDLVEAMHQTVATVGGVLGDAGRGRTRGITGLVYACVRSATRFVGYEVEQLLDEWTPTPPDEQSRRQRETRLAVLNGVLGEHLALTGNPLALPMQLRRDGRELSLPLPRATNKLVVLVHGLCMSDLQWQWRGHDHGEALARDLGFTPVYLRYNSGRHVSVNGREAAQALETLVAHWPVPLETLVLIGHSLGGLVCRSACHHGEAAGHAWRRRLRKLVFLGTPHHGAPLERGGSWVETLLGVNPYSAPFARLGRVRSAGITDLRYGNVVDEDWEGRPRFGRTSDQRRPVPLPEGVECYAVAASLGPGLGDGLVPQSSALGRHPDPARTLAFPASHQWVAPGIGHQMLLGSPEVYAVLARWLTGPGMDPPPSPFSIGGR